ncbi:MAG: hypothetical protein ACD_75C02206G0001 [uncultured bacterium]|nr:MAG: hypothetical protein ACD_75C02206G0001 [uncultured bacterium]
MGVAGKIRICRELQPEWRIVILPGRQIIGPEQLISPFERLNRDLLAGLQLLQYQNAGTDGAVKMAVFRSHEREAGQLGDMASHRLIFGDAAAENDFALWRFLATEERIDNISSKSPAQPVADLVQLIAFLLGMNEVGLGEDGTARGDLRAFSGAAAGDFA